MVKNCYGYTYSQSRGLFVIYELDSLIEVDTAFTVSAAKYMCDRYNVQKVIVDCDLARESLKW